MTTPTSRKHQGTHRLAEFGIPACCCLFLLFSCIFISPAKWFWFDETLTYYPVTDPSFAHMIAACREPMNTAPPLYFMLGWLYVHLAGASELSLRLFSSIAMSLSVLVMWRLLRPRFGTAPASVGLIGGLYVMSVREQNAEARFYGLYLLFAAVLLYLFVTVNEQRSSAQSETKKNRSLIALSVTALCLVFTHTLGIAFSGSLLVAQFYLDWRFSRSNRKPIYRSLFIGVYSAIICAWILFAGLWGRVAIEQQHAFLGHTWIPKPTPLALFNMIFEAYNSGRIVHIVPILLGLIASFFLFHRKGQHTDPDAPVRSVEIANVAGLCYLIIPVTLTYIVSTIGTSIFLDRYLLPHWLGWMLVAAYGCYSFSTVIDNKRPFGVVIAASCAVILLLMGKDLLKSRKDLQSAQVSKEAIYSGIEKAYKQTSLPVCIASPLVFQEMHYQMHKRHGGGIPIKFLFKDPVMIERSRGKFLFFSLYINLSALNRSYPISSVVDEDNFLQANNRFAVCDEPLEYKITHEFIRNDDYLVSSIPGVLPVKAKDVPQSKTIAAIYYEISRHTRSIQQGVN